MKVMKVGKSINRNYKMGNNQETPAFGSGREAEVLLSYYTHSNHFEKKT